MLKSMVTNRDSMLEERPLLPPVIRSAVAGKKSPSGQTQLSGSDSSSHSLMYVVGVEEGGTILTSTSRLAGERATVVVEEHGHKLGLHVGGETPISTRHLFSSGREEVTIRTDTAEWL